MVTERSSQSWQEAIPTGKVDIPKVSVKRKGPLPKFRGELKDDRHNESDIRRVPIELSPIVITDGPVPVHFAFSHKESPGRPEGSRTEGSSKAPKPWPKEDWAKVRRLYEEGKVIEEISEITGRSVFSIERKMRKMGYAHLVVRRRVFTPRKWTNDKIAVIRAMAAEGKYYRDIAEEFGTSEELIRKLARIYKIKVSHRPSPSGVPWSEEDDAILKAMYGVKTDEEVAEMVGRSGQAVRARAKRLALSKRRKRNEVCGEEESG